MFRVFRLWGCQQVLKSWLKRLWWQCAKWSLCLRRPQNAPQISTFSRECPDPLSAQVIAETLYILLSSTQASFCYCFESTKKCSQVLYLDWEPLERTIAGGRDHTLCFIRTQGLLVDQQNMLKELPCENKVSSSSSEVTLTPAWRIKEIERWGGKFKV